MTVEELEILVQASIEPALKELKKLMPEIKKEINKAKKEFESLNFKDVIEKADIKSSIEKQTKEASKQIKKANEEMNEYLDKNFKINGIKNLKKEITGISQQFKKMSSTRLTLDNMLDMQNLREKLAKAKEETQNAIKEINDIPYKEYNKQPVLDYINDYINGNGKKISDIVIRPNNNSPNINNKIDNQEIKLSNESVSIWDTLKQKIQQTKPVIEKVKQLFNSTSKEMNAGTNKVRNSANQTKNTFSKISDITIKINNNIKQMGTGMKQGLSHILKYAGALFSLRGIYSVLSSSANSWLSSQNTQAQQLSSNIEYMKYAMGSVFAPVIEYVTNLVYQLMKAIQSLVYAFSGVNIFAKATASSMNKTAGSAKQTNKSLAGIHSEINNVSENKDSNGSGSVSPNMDLSEVDSSMNIWIDKIKEKLMPLFEPIKNSWNTYGQPMLNSMKYALNSNLSLIKTIGKSFGKIWNNGTGEHTVSTILQILTSIFNTIGNIHTAFANAWQNSGGTEIIQNLWNALNDVLDIVLGVQQSFEQWTASESFQIFANSIISICGTLSSWFEKITNKLREIWENGGQETFTKLLDFISKVSEAVDALMSFLSPVIDFAVELVGGAIETIIAVIGDVIDSLGGLLDFITGVFTGDWEKAWNGIKEFFSGIWNALKDLVSGIAEQIWTYIKGWLDNIKDSWNTIWEEIKNFASNIWDKLLNKIDNIFPGMREIIETNISKVKTNIETKLNQIKTGWTTIWNAVKDKTSEIWGNIWNAIKQPINWILAGVESMANGVVTGVNKVISSLNNIKFTMPDWLGGGSFGINLPKMSYVSLPRLKTGNVAYSETAAIFGEYAGARTNPEITAPQNILEETFDRVLSSHEWSNSGSQQHLSIYYMGKEIFDDTIDYINEKTRRTGKCVIKVGG